MKTKLAVLVVVALIAYGLKRHYADAGTDALSWILTPTAHLVGLVTGVAFAAVPGEGYFSAERMFLIEKACAGVNFMIAAFAMVAFALLHRARSAREGAVVLGVSLAASFLAAIVVNTVRIVIAMWLAAQPIGSSSLTPADIHRLEGITVYFGGLMLLYALVQRIDRGGAVFRYVLPLGCYYLVTLGLPLANGAAQASDAFLTHAVIVLLVPPVLMLLVSGASRLFSHYPRRNVSAGSSRHARRAGSHAASAETRTSALAPTR
jgi:exosortase K